MRFRPLDADKTQAAVEELCLSYRHAIDQEKVPPLLAVACLVLDFLCIHPFRDGNGRVARLISLLALYHHGIEVGRYISLERLVEETKEDYYEDLRRSSQGWHEGRHDIVPWLNYFFTIVRRGYIEFEERAGQMRTAKGAKTALLMQAMASYAGEFTARDLHRAVPGVSIDLVRSLLRTEKKAGTLLCTGRGPNAKWKRIR